MSKPTTAIQDRIIRAFTALDLLPPSPELRALHARLRAELDGDGDGVAATLTPDFTVTMHNGTATSSLSADAVIDGVRAQGAAGILLWTEFDVLAAASGTIAGTGHLCVVAGSTLTVTPMALSARFTGSRMSSESVFLAGATQSNTLDTCALPSSEQLRNRLGR
ncbi:hypothetical protein BA059_19475 [Mycolicibacterium sp. (ex Dasyatis americana)]|nr:hypothetical protein BA059_19475 [Mycolicibacterium sp. (ex Dasyatis americana)]